MAVLVSKGATSLSTANGWYRAESYNVGMATAGVTQLASIPSVNLPVTFANAGNCQGIILSCRPNTAPATDISARTMTVRLCEVNTPVTVTIASPGVITWNTASPAENTPFVMTTTGALPTGLTANTVYYVKNAGATTSNFSATAGGTAINTTGSQSGTHSGWIERAVKTMRFDEMLYLTDYTKYHQGDWIVPFEFDTPYAVDTTASKWRFLFNTNSSSYMSIGYSTAGNYTHITWCDNTLTFADNDVIVCKDIVTIDQTATLGTVTPTGLATNLYSAIVTRSMSMAASACKLQWQNPPSASYTLTVKGRIALGTHSGVSIGSDANPISYANRAIIDFSAGTWTEASFYTQGANGAGNQAGKANLYLFGAYDTSIRTTLNGAVANGASSFTTTASTGWASGDIITVGRPAQGGNSRQYYTVSSTSGTTVNITGTIAGARSSGGQVVKLNRTTGILIIPGPSSSSVAPGTNFSNLQMRGVEIAAAGNSQSFFYDNHSNLYSENNAAFVAEDPNNLLAENFVEYCNFYSTNGNVATGAFNTTYMYSNGMRIKYCNFHCIPPMWNYYSRSDSTSTAGYLRLLNNVFIHYNNGSTGNFAFITPVASPQTSGQLDIEDNVFEGSQHAFLCLAGLNLIHKNNSYWGGGSATAVGDDGAVIYTQLINPIEISGNIYNANACGVSLYTGTIIGAIEKNSVFGNISANTKDVMQHGGSYVDFEFANCSTISNYSLTNLTTHVNGTNIKFSTLNGTTNNDSGYLKYGYFQRTGSGLSDTTVHTAGGTAMRFQPVSSTNSLTFSFKVPTGNIYNQTMSVAVWCKLNSATYYAGTNQLPRLTVDYDNGTIAYSQAAQSTSWQLLIVSFTPATTYGELTVTLSARTGASGSSAYVYFDDMAILYPAGYQLDLGALDIWAHALPVTPPIATNLSALSVWTASSTVDYGANTMGEKVTKKLLSVAKFIGLK